MAVSAAQRMLSDRPDVVLTYGSSISLALRPLLDEMQVPSITVAVNPDVAGGLMILNYPSARDYVIRTVEEMNLQSFERIGLIYRNDDFGIAVREALEDIFEGEVHAEALDPDEQDYRTPLLKLKEREVDALFLLSTGKTLGTLIVQARQYLDVPLYSTLDVNYPDVAEAAGVAYSGITYSDIDLDYGEPGLARFKDAYVDRYGAEPGPDAVFGYNAMLLVGHCIGEAEFARCLAGAEFEGLSGRLRVQENKVRYESAMTLQTT